MLYAIFFCEEGEEEVLSLVLGLAFSVFSVFCFWLSSFAKKTRKEEDAFLATKRRERLMTALFLFTHGHTRTPTSSSSWFLLLF